MCYRLGCDVPYDNMQVASGYDYKEGFSFFEFKLIKTRIRESDYNSTFFEQYWSLALGQGDSNKRGNEFLRKYYYTHKDRNEECMSHLFKYKTQCTTDFWKESADMWDYTPYPPRYEYDIPLESCRFWNEPTKSNASRPAGRYGNSNRTTPSVYPKEIIDTHALFYGGLPKIRFFNAYFFKAANKCRKRIEVIKKMKEKYGYFADANFNIFECHYLSIDDALEFELEYLKFLRSNIGRWTRKEKEEPFDKMAGGKNFHPLNEFWEVEKGKGLYKTMEMQNAVFQNSLAGSKKFKPDGILDFMDSLKE